MARLDISILLFDRFSNMVLACLVEPLRVVRDQTGAEIAWSILTPDDAPVISSSGLRISPDMPRAHAPRPGLSLVVGGDTFRDAPSQPVLRTSLSQMIRADTIIAADTGAWLLARCGHLDGRRATLHWQLLDEFAETFPRVTLSADRHVRDGRFWTCGSAAAALDLTLAFIGDRYGAAAAFDAGAMFLHDNSRQFGASFPEGALARRGSDRLRRILRRLSDQSDRAQSVAEIARASHMSERSLHRLFLRELGMTPARYHLLLRLARARELALNSELSLDAIALRCGFSGATTLSRAYRRHYDHGLRSLRTPQAR